MAEELPQAVANVLPRLLSHRAVHELVGKPQPGENGNVRVTVAFEVALASRDRPRGYSDTGVRSLEPVTLDFPPTFPWQAPTVSLREDFNRNLPHINPGRAGEPVLPCLYEGDLSTLLHQSGWIDSLLNQISEWLARAATDRLIDSEQGWEPVRRDAVKGVLIFETDRLRTQVKDSASGCFFVTHLYLTENGRPLSGIVLDQTLQPRIQDTVSKQGLEIRCHNGLCRTYTLGVMAWPDLNSVTEQYLPETVTTLAELHRQAKGYGCDIALDYRLKEAFEKARRTKTFGTAVPLVVMLCIRRPLPLINDNSPLELLPYMALCRVGDNGQLDEHSPVSPFAHLHALSPDLLRRLSGAKSAPNQGHLVLLGCGSLGSKMALHLARAGHGPWWLMDHDQFLPHNVARHALTAQAILHNKAEALAIELEPLMGNRTTQLQTQVQVEDVLEVLARKPKPFPQKARLIIDATASLAVRKALAAIPVTLMPGAGRLMNVSLYAEGRLGVMALEGPARNPRVDDLLAWLFDRSLNDTRLRQVLFGTSSGLSRQAVGQGCGSQTMVMADARLSLHAAGLAELCRHYLEESFPQTGELALGLLDPSGLGVTWDRQPLQPSQVLSTQPPGSRQSSAWSVRLLAPVVETLTDRARAAGKDETGGVLFGHIDHASQCITVTRQIDPPPDSQADTARFVLGTQGLQQRVHDLQQASAGWLTYVGTWHSHPRGGGASRTDRETLARLKALRLGEPSVALIWTPEGFQLLFDAGMTP